EALRRIDEGAAAKSRFSLEDLAAREIESGSPFVCGGGKEKCDRKCLIARYRIDGKIFPFGGACDRYYNLKPSGDNAPSADLVRDREETVFRSREPSRVNREGKPQIIGISSSLFSNTFFPLYQEFFSDLGLKVVRSKTIRQEGLQRAGAAFCLPLFHSHGHLCDLLERGVDRIFIPHVKGFPSGDKDAGNCTCPLVQGEPYILRAAFNEALSDKLLTVVLDFSRPAQAREAFIQIGKDLGFPVGQASRSYNKALEAWRQGQEELAGRASKLLADLGPEETAIVLFGRPYNAFASLANMGIPAKFASRGYPVVPHDILPAAGNRCREQQRMYYATGRGILAAAEFVRDNPKLFGVFITSFSCGPDSFLLERFRTVMGDKPFLILELDAHTADAGVDTRIEAFLDVARSYRRAGSAPSKSKARESCRIVMEKGTALVRKKDGRKIPITSPEIHFLVPSMGDVSSRYFAAALRFAGVRASAVPRPGRDELILGSECASCKECLPYLLTSGSLRRYLRDRADNGETLLYMVPEANGPCRFGLYGEAIRALINREGIEDIAIFSPSSSNGYQGFPDSLLRRGFLAIAIADGLVDIRAAILTLARDHTLALQTFEEVVDSICRSIASDPEKKLEKTLQDGMARLAGLERSGTIRETTKVLLTGEIYVRKDSFSNYEMVRRLAEEGILVRTSPSLEWISYIDHIVITGILGQATLRERMAVWLRNRIGGRIVGRVQKILETSGFYSPQDCDMAYLMEKGGMLIHPSLTGEAILTVGSTLSEIGDKVHGVISISPFGCMPGRLAEAIITHRLKKDKPFFSRNDSSFWEAARSVVPLPFLALETDGSVLSQMAEAKLESFIRSAHRLKEEMGKRGEGKGIALKVDDFAKSHQRALRGAPGSRTRVVSP
ncbi:MAG: CoA activase, partial [Proteobacteria bacterium]|nr:CoA activase [Pseudomonadota bacterium]